MSRYNNKYPVVIIREPGECYSSYYDWYDKYCSGFDYKHAGLNDYIYTKAEGVLLTKGPHSLGNQRLLYAFLHNNLIFIINDDAFIPKDLNSFLKWKRQT